VSASQLNATQNERNAERFFLSLSCDNVLSASKVILRVSITVFSSSSTSLSVWDPILVCKIASIEQEAMYMHLENSTTELVHGSDGEAYYEPCREKRRSISSVLFQIAIGSSIFACGVLIGALGFIKQPGDEKSALSKINTYSKL
jgi:hypothetical protein